MKRENKDQLIAELADRFQRAQSLYLADFSGMNVQKMEQLRIKFREVQSEFKVVKNTLALKALDKAGYKIDLGKYLEGPTGIAFGYDDAIAPAKVISDFLREKENNKLKVKVSVIDKEIFTARIDDIARMPTRKDSLSMLVGLLNAPMQNLVLLISSPMQNLVGILESLKNQRA
jgi:large subunit ribosomal protein L10